ncbi:hypothetical protein NP590_20145 [Methylomonas sp. SURF-2]|uniref:Uncharacterized protein n=1 Tax=Methylomonas subterranea TaxID=2952225 RepID=A0ABT1TLS4_9GAMM|nr:hypothetical protein [Methylomonas sp. SURF-2]MCQ8106421.1 hypothetical protein [Methylomonas sp. SURF-2]
MNAISGKHYYLFISIVLLFSCVAQADYNDFLETIRSSIVPESDTIFLGKKAGYKTIENGYITDSGEVLSIAIIQVEVVKPLKGKIKAGEKHLVCTWFIPGGGSSKAYGFSYGKDNDEITILGIATEYNIQLPQFRYHLIGGFDIEPIIKEGLKLPEKPNEDKSRILTTFSEPRDKIIRNACNEANSWP